MKIAIYFGDSDFNSTFEKVALKLLESYALGIPVYNWDKKNILSVINSISYGIHRLHQTTEENLTQEEIQELVEYLQIKEENVFIDEEVDSFLKKYTGNYEVVVIILNYYDSTVYIV